MKKINLFIAALFVLTLVASCGKDGAVGPQGPKGDTGAAGPTGTTGTAGANGSVIYSGNGAPSGTQGVAGDYYIDLASGNFYGPKTASGWGTPISLKGANGTTGATGAAGSKILSGSGAPASGLGNNGDYYLDKTTYLFYGPKTASGWGTGLSLQGPQGNANIQIDTFTVKTADWTYGGVYYFGTVPGVSQGFFTQYYDRANTLITQNFLDAGGLVMIYFQSEPDIAPSTWQPLPYTFTTFGNYQYNYYYETSAGNVRLHFWLSKVLTDPPALNGFQQPNRRYKIVVMTGTVISMIKNNHVDLKDYKAVSKITGLWQQDKL